MVHRYNCVCFSSTRSWAEWSVEGSTDRWWFLTQTISFTEMQDRKLMETSRQEREKCRLQWSLLFQHHRQCHEFIRETFKQRPADTEAAQLLIGYFSTMVSNIYFSNTKNKADKTGGARNKGKKEYKYTVWHDVMLDAYTALWSCNLHNEAS